MIEKMKQALEAAYLAGFNASGEGYNGEYPFGDKMQDPSENRVWKKDRDNYVSQAIAKAEKQEVERQLDAHAKKLRETYLTPQCQWVGLSDEDVEMIVENRRAAHWEFVRQVEAKLKEKNT